LKRFSILYLSSLLLLPPGQTESAGTWTPVGPSGGTIFALERDPFDPQALLAGTYFGGLYRSLNGGQSWLHVDSPFSSFGVFCIAFHPRARGVVYAGTFEGGLYQSFDGGQSWTVSLPGTTVQAVAVDPNEPTVVLAATTSGLFKSETTGASWLLLSGSFFGRSLAFDPVSPGVVFLSTLDSRSVFRSGDRGDHWEEFNNGLQSKPITSLHWDSKTGNTLYATSTDAAAFKLTRGSTVWTDISNGLPQAPIGQILAHPFFDSLLYAATDEGVFASLDGGSSWFASFRSKEIRPRSLLANPSGSLIYAGTLGNGVMITSDFGESWSTANQGMQNLFVGTLTSVPTTGGSVLYSGSNRGIHFSDDPAGSWTRAADFDLGVIDLQADPSAAATVFAGTEKNGLFKSTDSGLSWTSSSEGLVPPLIFSLAQSPVSPNQLYAGSLTGFYVSRDEGRSWTTSTPMAVYGVLSVAADPVRPGVAFFGGFYGTVYKTFDGGDTFFPASAGLPGDHIVALRVSPLFTDRVYAISQAGALFASDDGGLSWAFASQGVAEGVHSMDIHPSEPWIIYLGATSGVYKSVDGGSAWHAKRNGLAFLPVTALALDPLSPNTLYAGSFGRVSKSTNGAESWADASQGLPASWIVSLLVDPRSSAVLYASLLDQGVYKSNDGGASWAPMGEGLPAMGKVSMVLSTVASDTLYAGTTLRGVFASQDGARTWSSSSKGMSPFIKSIAIDPLTPQTLYAGALFGGFFASSDGGASWNNLGLVNHFILDVVLDPQDPRTIYVATTMGTLRSDDRGASWVSLGPTNGEGFGIFVLSLAVNPRTPSVVYAATGGEGVFKSANRGGSWTPVNQGLANRSVLSIVIDPVEPETVYAGTAGGGVFLTRDGGGNWELPASGLFNPLVTALAIDALDHSVVYAGTEGGGVFKLTIP